MMTFRPITRCFRDYYAPHKTFADGNKVMRRTTEAGNALYAYVNTKANEYCRLPHWLATTIKEDETITYIIGPWIFINGFENTPEGKYLCKIFPYYFKMSETTKKKVQHIVDQYGWWVRIHKAYVNGINEARKRI